MELGAGHQLTVQTLGSLVACFVVHVHGGCLLILVVLQSMDNTDGPRVWLGWLAVVDPLVTVNIDRRSNMKY